MQYAIETLLLEQKRLEGIFRQYEYEKNTASIQNEILAKIEQLKKTIKLLTPSRLGNDKLMDVCEVVCLICNASIDDVRSKSRCQDFINPRYYTMWIAKKFLNLQPKAIAPFFNIDRSSVSHAITAVNKMMDEEDHIRQVSSIVRKCQEENIITYPTKIERKTIYKLANTDNVYMNAV